MGPTSIGKTALSLCKQFNIEIVSVDSYDISLIWLG